MQHSVSIIIAAGLFGISSDLVLAQQAPNRDRPSQAQNGNVGDATTAKPNFSSDGFSNKAVKNPPDMSPIDKLMQGMRAALKTLQLQVNALQLRVDELEAQQRKRK